LRNFDKKKRKNKMDNTMKTYKFGEESVQAPASLSVDEVRTMLAEAYPAVLNATAVQNADGTTEFVVQAGTKG
jgi:hypothetical protein